VHVNNVDWLSGCMDFR